MKYSDRISAFQPPPHAVILPVTSEGSSAGIMTLRQVAIRESPNERAASRKSLGTWLTPAIRLNSTYHCIPVRISRIEARFMPPVTLITNRTINGNSAVAGIEPAISAVGASHRLKRGLSLAISAHGKVHASEIA